MAYKLRARVDAHPAGRPDSSIGRRAGFARHNLWVTPYTPGRATGRRATTPTSTPAGTGCPAWTAADRSLVDTEIVVWHTFGVTHSPRPEDWPVMPVEYCGFHLVPVGFFDAQPGARRAAAPATAADRP